jgi:hypothetical protein
MLELEAEKEARKLISRPLLSRQPSFVVDVTNTNGINGINNFLELMEKEALSETPETYEDLPSTSNGSDADILVYINISK